MSQEYGRYLFASYKMLKLAQEKGGMRPVELLLFLETMVQEIEEALDRLPRPEEG
jgi:hypothetical protein